MKYLLQRQQAKQSFKFNIKSGLGGLFSITVIAWLSTLTDSLLLMAPFGASCVLLFSLPQSPLSQPVNVIAGHIVSSIIGLLMYQYFPVEWWSPGLAVGLSITIMAGLRISHPPAGANPLVIFLGGFGWEYLVFPVITGSVLLVLLAWIFHKLPPHSEYPVLEKTDN